MEQEHPLHSRRLRLSRNAPTWEALSGRSVALRVTVPVEWVDVNRHLGFAHYLALATAGLDRWWSGNALCPAAHRLGRQKMAYWHEVAEGEELTVRLALARGSLAPRTGDAAVLAAHILNETRRQVPFCALTLCLPPLSSRGQM